MWIKLLIVIGAGYFLFRMFTNDARHKKKETKQEQEEKVATGDLIKDPVCGAYIDADSGVTVRDGEVIHRFCSYECRDTFLKRLQAAPIDKVEEKVKVEEKAEE